MVSAFTNKSGLWSCNLVLPHPFFGSSLDPWCELSFVVGAAFALSLSCRLPRNDGHHPGGLGLPASWSPAPRDERPLRIVPQHTQHTHTDPYHILDLHPCRGLSNASFPSRSKPRLPLCLRLGRTLCPLLAAQPRMVLFWTREHRTFRRAAA